MKKHLLKQVAFILLILMVVYSCEKDEFEEIQIDNTRKLTVTIIDLSDIESNKKAFSKIERIINLKNESKKSYRDTISNNEYGFIIDTDYVKYLENGNYNSYNFEIIRDNPEDDKLENLFLTLNEDEEYDAFIIKYDFTIEELNGLTQDELDSRTTQYTAIDFDSSFLNRGSAFRDADLECESQWVACGLAGEHDASCNFGWSQEIVCTGGGGPGPGPSTSDPTSDPISGGNQGSGGPGGSNGGTYTPSNPYSAPTAPTRGEILSTYFGELTEEQITWANNNRTAYEQLIAYLGSCNLVNAEIDARCDVILELGELAFEAMVKNDLTFKEVTTLIIDSFDTPKINDIEEELECFDSSLPAKMTVYCQQSITGSRVLTANIGHTFIGIEQGGVIRNIGFYSDSPYASLIGPQGSELHDNSTSPYDVSISVDISALQLQEVVNYMVDYPTTYYLNDYNCTDFGIAIAGLGGLTLPETIGEYNSLLFDFEGRNPSDLGEDMRVLSLPSGATRDLDGGNAPSRSPDCP